MLNKFFARPLELTVGEQTLKFSSVSDFEFSVAGRIAVPSKKIVDMVKFSLDQLKKEAKTIKEIEKRFVSILSRSIEDPNSINRAMRELDPLIFSQDHGWREIIAALNNGEEEFNPFRRIALVKYMQYLSARQEIIKYLYSEKKKYQEEQGRETETGEAAKLKDTLILENTLFEPVAEQRNQDSYERMPKGEAVTITLSPGTEVEVLLSRHACKLIASDEKIRFVDQAGRSYDLNRGRSVIGRDTASTVMIDPSLRDVSRLHLVVENFDGNTVQLTDMSSHGTYVPARFLEHHSSW